MSRISESGSGEPGENAGGQHVTDWFLPSYRPSPGAIAVAERVSRRVFHETAPEAPRSFSILARVLLCVFAILGQE